LVKAWPYACVFLAAATWGALGPMGAYLNTVGFSGREVASLRIAFAALLLAAAFPFLSRGFRPYSRMIVLVGAHAVVGVVGYNVAYFMAVSRIGVTPSVALLYTSPFWTVVGSSIFLGIGLNIKQIGLATLSVAGVSLVLFPTLAGQGVHFDAVGVIAALVSAICYALYGVLGKRCLNRGLTPTDLLFSSFLIAGLGNLASPDLWSGLGQLTNNASLKVLLSLLGIGWVGTVMSYFLFTRGLDRISATSVGLITPIEPITAVIIATALLHEPLNPVQFGGFCLIVGSAVLGALPSMSGPMRNAARHTRKRCLREPREGGSELESGGQGRL